MSFQFSLSGIIYNGNWESVAKPYICEYPQITDDKFLFRRGVRFERTSKSAEELGFNRTHESEESVEMYEIKIHAPTVSGIDEIIKQMRKIAIGHTHSVYNQIDININVKYSYNRGQVIGEAAVICYLGGMPI